jgi:enoyl-CoA hydratase/carnithine racemase
MKYETLKYEKEDGFVVVTMNRPHRLNAMSAQFMKEFNLAHHEILKDREVRAWIITGAPRPDGRPCFSAGADLKDDAEGNRDGTILTIGGHSISQRTNCFP